MMSLGHPAPPAKPQPPARLARAARHFMAAFAILAVAGLTPSHSTPRALSLGPGLPKLRFAAGEVGTSLAALPAQLPNGMIAYEHGQPFFLGGQQTLIEHKHTFVGPFNGNNIEIHK